MKPTQPFPYGRGVRCANWWRGQAQGPPQRPPGISQVARTPARAAARACWKNHLGCPVQTHEMAAAIMRTMYFKIKDEDHDSVDCFVHSFHSTPSAATIMSSTASTTHHPPPPSCRRRRRRGWPELEVEVAGQRAKAGRRGSLVDEACPASVVRFHDLRRAAGQFSG